MFEHITIHAYLFINDTYVAMSCVHHKTHESIFSKEWDKNRNVGTFTLDAGLFWACAMCTPTWFLPLRPTPCPFLAPCSYLWLEWWVPLPSVASNNVLLPLHQQWEDSLGTLGKGDCVTRQKGARVTRGRPSPCLTPRWHGLDTSEITCLQRATEIWGFTCYLARVNLTDETVTGYCK